MPDAAPLLADPTEIHRDLAYMTARWGELRRPLRFELRAFKEGAQPQTAMFRQDWIDEAVDWAEQMNGLGFNLYAVRNPIRDEATGSASDADIVASFFLWADCDDPAAAGNVHRFEGPRWSAAVTTGRIPALRVHTYWQLAEPCLDMAAWREMQIAIAAHFGSDPKVINPSRIMRLGGTVSYPARHKVERGYTRELTTIRTEYPDAREPVTLEQMRRVFAVTAPARPAISIDTGTAPAGVDLSAAARLIQSGKEWRDPVMQVVGKLVAKGFNDDDIHILTDGFTQPGYTIADTRKDVQEFIDGARRKGWDQAAESATSFDHPTGTVRGAAPGWKMQTAAEFTADFVSPEYVVDGVIRRGMLYTLTAPTGSGKTAVMLYAATAIASAMYFGDREVEPGDVIFMAGENPDDVRARFIATMEFYAIDPAKCRVHFIAGTFSIRADMERLREEAAKLPNLILIVIDTFAAYFDGDDENSNAQALDFARVARKLTAFPSRPAVVMPAHPVKNATRQNLTPKGGSSLVNDVDGNLTLWNDEGILTLHWQVKFRGAEFEPLRFELEKFQSHQLKDHKGRLMPTILAKPMLELRAKQIARETMRDEDKLLLNVRDNPGQSAADRATEIGIRMKDGSPYKVRVQRLLLRLQEQKLVRRFRTNWELTKEGERAVEIIEGGGFAPDGAL